MDSTMTNISETTKENTSDREIKNIETKNTKNSTKIIRRILIFLFVVELVILGLVYGYKIKSIQENKALEDNNFTLTNEIENLNVSIENLYNDIANTQIEIETLSNSNNELETQITSLESELSYYNEQINLLGGDMYE